MSETNSQRIYLTCGSAFLIFFSFAASIAIVIFGSGHKVEVFAVMALAVTIAVLLFNATMLFGSNGGPKVLASAKVLLWLAFLLIAVAIVLCVISMTTSL